MDADERLPADQDGASSGEEDLGLGGEDEVRDQYTLRQRFTVKQGAKSVPLGGGGEAEEGSDEEVQTVATVGASSASAEGRERVRKRFAKVKGMLRWMNQINLCSEMKLPEKCGWLERVTSEGGYFSKGTERVWVVLRQRTLRWFASPQDQASLGMIDFDIIPVDVQRLWKQDALARVTTMNKRSRCGGCDFMQPIIQALLPADDAVVFRISPVCCVGESLEWQAKNIAEGEDWVAVLTARLNQAAGVQELPSGAPMEGMHANGSGDPLGNVVDGQWWNVTSISPSKFAQVVRTGDILLFRSPGTLPQLIRTASGGRFDHVALLLRLEGGRIGLLEATGNQGVGLCSWDEFVAQEWFLIYQEIALRRVSFDRTEDAITELQQWAGSVLGKPYSLSIGKLMQRKSISEGGLPNDDAYFCSQLVAEALKVLKVLPRGKSSTQYWPASFEASMPQPECLDGCSFDDQLTLDFGPKQSDGSQAQPGRDVTAALW